MRSAAHKSAPWCKTLSSDELDHPLVTVRNGGALWGPGKSHDVFLYHRDAPQCIPSVD